MSIIFIKLCMHHFTLNSKWKTEKKTQVKKIQMVTVLSDEALLTLSLIIKFKT